MRYRTAVTEEVVGTWRFRFSCIESFEDAVDEMHRELAARGDEARLEALCPYFGFLWPGARLLARWIWEQGSDTFAGRRVLELGCGLALPSFVAARLGATVIATDNHPDVPQFFARNLQLNPEVPVSYRHLDWNEPQTSAGHYDWIIASDVLYERGQADALARFLALRLSPTGQAVVLDPNRPFWERLVGGVAAAGLHVTVDRPTPAVTLLRFRRR